jgi:splicing factor 45
VRVVEESGRMEEEWVRVFVLFTSELSALRGVNALDGRLFGGRRYVLFCDWLTCRIKARYYDADKFEAGDFR